MMKRVLFLLIVPLNIFAQSKVNISSLLNSKELDSIEAHTLSNYAYNLSINNPDSAIIVSKIGKPLCKNKNQFKSYVSFSSAEANALRCLGKFNLALNIYIDLLPKLEAAKMTYQRGAILGNIGGLYEELGDEELSLEYKLKSYKLLNDSINGGSNLQKAIILINIANSYTLLNKLDSARNFANAGFDLAKKTNTMIAQNYALIILGDIYLELNQAPVAIANYKLALPTKANQLDNTALIQIYSGLSNAFEKLNLTDSAFFYAKKTYYLSSQFKILKNIHSSSTFLYKYFDAEGNLDSSHYYLSVLNNAKDSLFNYDKLHYVQRQTIALELAEIESEKKKEIEEHETKKRIQYGFLAVGIITFSIIFILLINSTLLNEKWINFLGVLGLLLFFEFLNLLLHPWIASITNHSPALMLLIMVTIAAIIIPIHHKLEKSLLTKILLNNKVIRLKAAKATITKLEKG